MTSSGSSSVFAGFRFPPAVISVAVRWYLRYGLVVPGRGGAAGSARRHRRPRHRLPLGAAVHRRSSSRQPGRAATLPVTGGSSTRPYAEGGRPSGPTCTGPRRPARPGHRRLCCPLKARPGRPPGASSPGRCAPGTVPAEVTTDRAPVSPARPRRAGPPRRWHTVERHANNPVEADHWAAESPAPADARPQAPPLSADPRRQGHAFVQNLRRGHYDIALDVPACHRLRVVFDKAPL